MGIDNGTFEQMKRELYSSVLCDILDEFGCRNQAMSPRIVPLDKEMKIVGRALPVSVVDVYAIPERPYALEIEAVDALQAGDVMVVNAGGSKRSAFWGELLSTAAIARGARGTILDGYCRDTAKIAAMNYPVFCKGNLPYDSKGRNEVAAYGVPVECGGVLVHPGDIVFGDVDGIVVIPAALAEPVIEKALQKVHTEDLVRKELQAGMKLGEVFQKYGVL